MHRHGTGPITATALGTATASGTAAAMVGPMPAWWCSEHAAQCDRAIADHGQACALMVNRCVVVVCPWALERPGVGWRCGGSGVVRVRGPSDAVVVLAAVDGAAMWKSVGPVSWWRPA